MNTESRPKLSRYGKPLSAVACEEPSLIFCEQAGKRELLMAAGTRENCQSGGLILESVTHLRCADQCVCEWLDEVSVHWDDGVWQLEALPAKDQILFTSPTPPEVIFISRADFDQLQGKLSSGPARVYEAARALRDGSIDDDSTVKPAFGFQTTHWTLILSAGDLALVGSKQALLQFCTAYYEPVYAYVRWKTANQADAKELTQAFFAWFLEKQVLSKVRREGGRFRSYLLTVLKNFLINEIAKGATIKEGGGKTFVPFDDDVEARYQKGFSTEATPEELFDRKYALSVLDQVLKRLRDVYCERGKGRLFELLQDCLTGTQEKGCYEAASQELGMSQEALRMEVCRMRRTFRRFLREEVAARGTKPEEIEEEIRYLLTILSRW